MNPYIYFCCWDCTNCQFL